VYFLLVTALARWALNTLVLNIACKVYFCQRRYKTVNLIRHKTSKSRGGTRGTQEYPDAYPFGSGTSQSESEAEAELLVETPQLWCYTVCIPYLIDHETSRTMSRAKHEVGSRMSWDPL
jgi:hypothetical protein